MGAAWQDGNLTRSDGTALIFHLSPSIANAFGY
jgi:hypothetical protein